MGRRRPAQVVETAVAAGLIALTASAFGSTPQTVLRDRIDCATAIGDSWKQQTLLNIVKLCHGDFRTLGGSAVLQESYRKARR